MEYANRIIKCKNEDGEEITFNEREFNPFILASAEGIYDSTYTVNTTANTVIDGSEYQGSVMEARNIILTLMEKDNFDVNRELIDTIFIKGSVGVMTVVDASHTRTIEYYVESVTTTATPQVRTTTISLICPDPYFYDPNQMSIAISNIVPDFEFIHEFLEEKEEIGHYTGAGLGIIWNESAEKSLGCTMVLRAYGDVVNPRITKVETQEFLQLGAEGHPYTMHYGDVVTFVTTVGKKNAYYGTQQINQYLHNDSTFFQLTRGVNSIGFDAESGADYLALRIMYRYKYMRA